MIALEVTAGPIYLAAIVAALACLALLIWAFDEDYGRRLDVMRHEARKVSSGPGGVTPLVEEGHGGRAGVTCTASRPSATKP